MTQAERLAAMEVQRWERRRQRREVVRRERRERAEERLAAGRKAHGAVCLRFMAYVRVHRSDESAVSGQAFRFHVPEVVDAWEFFEDLTWFLAGWRPMRLRTEAQQAATRACIEQWTRLGAAVEPERWGPRPKR